MLSPEELLTGVRWKVLQELTKHSELTASEIAANTGVTLPGISQATQLLEAYNYISSKAVAKGPGRPRQKYKIKKSIAHMTVCADGFAQQLSFAPNPFQAALLRTFALPNGDGKWVQKLLITYDHLFEALEAVAFVDSGKDETHILVITEDVEQYREKYSSISLQIGKKKQKVVSWSHNYDEFCAGLARNEKYFNDLYEKAIVIYDPKQLIAKAHG
jgi:hypothetical protein